MSVRQSGHVIALMGFLFAGCAGSGLPEPNAAHLATARQSAPETTLEDLGRGRTNYRAKCGNCHALPAPSPAPSEGWQHEIDAMRTQQGVQLSDREARDIFLYLDSVSRAAR